MQPRRSVPKRLEFHSFSEFVSPGIAQAPGARLLIWEHPPVYHDRFLLGLTDWFPEDLERMGRFRHQAAKTSWALARLLFRTALRTLYGLVWSPALEVLGEYGKPGLRPRTCQFNWSHAPGVVCLAFSDAEEVGCDVEELARVPADYLELAQSCFTQADCVWIAQPASEDERRLRFLSLFVEREARGKRDGRGLILEWTGPPSERTNPPFYSDDLHLFPHGDDGRYLIAVSTDFAANPGPWEIRSYRTIIEGA